LLIRVEGRGTMKVSPAVREFAEQALAAENSAPPELPVIGFDLSACEYMDSTFLGCLVCLHRETMKRGSRLVIHADDEARQRLLGATHLETVLHCVSAEPEPTTDWVELTTATLDRQQFGWHIMECHRVLAELNCPQAAAFRAVADNLEQELGAAVSPGKTGNERTAKWRPGS
jgi:anti-anti-sigma factor